ncbi:MAG: hypothetical protein U0Q03_19995 [Acidimicrobiales bacterium]
MSTHHLQLHGSRSPRVPLVPARLVAAAPVAWLGLGVAVWAVGLFEPGDLAVELPIVLVLAIVLLLALTAAWLAQIVLVLLAFVTPTLTMIAAALADRLGGEIPERSPVERTLVTVAVVSLPALVGAVLVAHAERTAHGHVSRSGSPID